MNWFLAKIVYQVFCRDGYHTPQFEEQLRLVSANDKEEAIDKTNFTALLEENSFSDVQGNLVSWEFLGICGLFSLSAKEDGAAVFSRAQEVSHAESYLEQLFTDAGTFDFSLQGSDCF